MTRRPPSASQLRKAAEARAGGASWEAVAALVGRKAATVRRWPAVYAERWARAARAAERQLLADATAESVHTLRRQLRSDDEKTSREAAQKLIQFRVAVGKTAKPKPGPAAAKPTSDVQRAAAYLETLTHDQLARLFDDLVRHWLTAHAGRGVPENPGGEGGPEHVP
jgi:hypothetical protein